MRPTGSRLKGNMMYKDRFAVAIKHNGKILRENKDLVHLPFGSEFSVLVKNLNSRRAKFTLHIDGTDVLDGEEIIVNANSEVEMKRFIRNGNMNEGNAFKFIERTQAIEDGPRGIKMDDGIVRIQFWFEQEPATVTTTTHIHKDIYHKDIWWNDYYRTGYFGQQRIFGEPYNGMLRSVNSTSTSNIASDAKLMASLATGDKTVTAQAMNIAQQSSASFSSNASSGMAKSVDSYSAEVNEAGITVPGSKVDQKFTPVYGFKAEEISNVIIIRMAGKTGETPVAVAVTVKTKNICSTCSHTNKHNAKFCSECGTGLELL
jgi:hypothetical protein